MAESIAQSDQEETERKARRQNAADLWDALWGKEGRESWRANALARVYARTCKLIESIKRDVSVSDIGGGAGILASMINDIDNVESVTVIDNSPAALGLAAVEGLETSRVDLEQQFMSIPKADVYVSTECLEHLSERARKNVMRRMTIGSSAIVSVPNNRLGPEEEPQHTIKYNAVSLKRDLEKHFEHVRVEVVGFFLLGVCGELAKKPFTLSATLPVRDEEHDLEATLASIRGIADELVVGIDPRTKDKTFEVASLYADEVFYLENPMGPPRGHDVDSCSVCNGPCQEYMGENGIHFSWARNQCIDRCSGDWIFMIEGHERLVAGQDVLLNLHKLPEKTRVGLVLRRGNGTQWAFPWLFQNAKDIRFERPVHNTLVYPEKSKQVILPNVITLHERHHDRSVERADQRRSQNRATLFDDWLSKGSQMSLFYLGQEWRESDPKRAIERLEQFLHVSNNGVMKYQARLILAKERLREGDPAAAKRILHGCTADDWSRSEHFVWLGDIAYSERQFEKAKRFYEYAYATVEQAPVTVWWIELSYYSYIPAQRLAMTCGELGLLQDTLEYCRAVLNLLPDDAPPELWEEAERNLTIVEESLS